MRRLLEASWNIETMGAVPTNPEDAADAAATSIQSAVDNGESLFFVDLLLPSYDISQGKKHVR
jgi:mannose/fructose-specific phosphotransferase system component IIA